MCRRQATNETRKEGLKSYADMTIYAMPIQTGADKIMCHHKLSPTIVILVTFSGG